ncbi:MAG: type II toxin-antitoxin system prevent-host-death family antitoxin [Lentisphaeria bacterium]
MISVNTHEAKTRLSELLMLVETGQDSILICRHGRPVAELVKAVGAPPRSRNKIYPELTVDIKCDPCAPLDDDAWPVDYR